MLKMPLAKIWQSGDFDEYKSRLRELVVVWKELNDALFWCGVNEARNRLDRKKSERLVDAWPVQWVGHYWNFGSDRFNDVIGFVATCDFLDDKMVALSLAHRLFIQAGRPVEWLSELKLVVDGNSTLEGQLETLLNPPVSSITVEAEERRARRDQERQHEEEERLNNRVQWIERLKAAPEVIRHPLTLNPGELSEDQYRLLRSIENSGLRASRTGGAHWEALLPEFGVDVARAYRDASILHWRNFTPSLRSEGGDTTIIPYSLIFAMAGIEIEASEVDSFPENLTKERGSSRASILCLGAKWLPKLARKISSGLP